jgi:hypothetical protein
MEDHLQQPVSASEAEAAPGLARGLVEASARLSVLSLLNDAARIGAPSLGGSLSNPKGCRQEPPRSPQR